jgi:hypothetical protein
LERRALLGKKSLAIQPSNAQRSVLMATAMGGWRLSRLRNLTLSFNESTLCAHRINLWEANGNSSAMVNFPDEFAF